MNRVWSEMKKINFDSVISWPKWSSTHYIAGLKCVLRDALKNVVAMGKKWKKKKKKKKMRWVHWIRKLRKKALAREARQVVEVDWKCGVCAWVLDLIVIEDLLSARSEKNERLRQQSNAIWYSRLMSLPLGLMDSLHTLTPLTHSLIISQTRFHRLFHRGCRQFREKGISPISILIQNKQRELHPTSFFKFQWIKLNTRELRRIKRNS